MTYDDPEQYEPRDPKNSWYVDRLIARVDDE